MSTTTDDESVTVQMEPGQRLYLEWQSGGRTMRTALEVTSLNGDKAMLHVHLGQGSVDSFREGYNNGVVLKGGEVP